MSRPVTLLVLTILLVGCVRAPASGGAASPSPLPPTPTGPLHLESPAFADGAAIPRKHTCDGDGVSPPLVISGAPSNASTIALEVIDPDVPTPIAAQREFVHWLAWNAPLANGSVVFDEGTAPNGTLQGSNGSGEPSYAAPCPPQGSPAHRYVFTAFAVDGALNLKEGSTREQLDAALTGHVIAGARLVGTYQRALIIGKQS